MSRITRALLAIVVLVFCTAPTPGDIGGCGQAPDHLDAPTFFANKKRIDCERCEECGARLTKREIELALERGGPSLCTVHANEMVSMGDEDSFADES